MPTYIGLLRAVNVGGTGKVRMEALRTLLSRMGLEGVQTLLQSGNVVFRSRDSDNARVEGQLEARIMKDLNVATQVFVRSVEEWSAIVGNNPFSREAVEAPQYLHMMALKAAPSPEGWKALKAAIPGRELLREGDRCAYFVYPDGVGTSRLTSALIEKHLATRGTLRNWNTVTKLAVLAASVENPSSGSR